MPVYPKTSIVETKEKHWTLTDKGKNSSLSGKPASHMQNQVAAGLSNCKGALFLFLFTRQSKEIGLYAPRTDTARSGADVFFAVVFCRRRYRLVVVLIAVYCKEENRGKGAVYLMQILVARCCLSLAYLQLIVHRACRRLNSRRPIERERRKEGGKGRKGKRRRPVYSSID